ncbi:MAG: hypothetical protein Q7K45_02450, partial [Nanoarchaeota archaeon]|nr:hypothetical protein [Nanoarchaeota archaeon]
MTFNKRAIVLKFLVTVILAIIIFAPACVFLSKFFRLSEQAEGSFNEFTTALTNLNQGKKEKDSFLLKIDAKTAVVYFEPNQEKVFLFIEGTGSDRAGSGDVYFTRPNQCSDKIKSCLCLFQDVEGDRKYVDENRKRCSTSLAGCDNYARVHSEATFSTAQGRCVQDISLPLSLESCTFGTVHNSVGYLCKNGFAIE